MLREYNLNNVDGIMLSSGTERLPTSSIPFEMKQDGIIERTERKSFGTSFKVCFLNQIITLTNNKISSKWQRKNSN